MAEQKRKMAILGAEMDMVDVPIKKATEFFNEYELEDGSVLNVKSVATSILRFHDQFTPDGRPLYLVLTSPAVSVKKSLLSRRKKTKK